MQRENKHKNPLTRDRQSENLNDTKPKYQAAKATFQKRNSWNKKTKNVLNLRENENYSVVALVT